MTQSTIKAARSSITECKWSVAQKERKKTLISAVNYVSFYASNDIIKSRVFLRWIKNKFAQQSRSIKDFIHESSFTGLQNFSLSSMKRRLSLSSTTVCVRGLLQADLNYYLIKKILAGRTRSSHVSRSTWDNLQVIYVLFSLSLLRSSCR